MKPYKKYTHQEPIEQVNEILTRLIGVRKELGYSTAYVSNELGYKSSSTVRRIEKGGVTLSLEVMLKLCELYEVDPVWVLSGKETVNLSYVNRLQAAINISKRNLQHIIDSLDFK